MRKIAVLDKHTIDKIAAGEVVERPSSVVKELVENAIDAQATAITVEITDGGKKLIRITDNGSGIDAAQISTAFLRHATSKIVKVEDLEQIASLGFRGEALSSIAAVSQVEVITKTPTSISGTHYVIEGGVEMKLEEMGAPEGTTFLIRNLFFNTPARSKFLKSDTTEANYISVLMEQLALSHPEISFKYIQNKQVKLHTSGNYNIKDIIYNVYGRDIAKNLLEVQYENDFMKIVGFAGKPEISRGNRTFENYYINGRYVKDKIITKAIEDAYKGFVMQHKFPFVSLHIEMEGNDLDVNVHPSKMEVRFARGAEVYDAVYQTIRGALTHRELIPAVTPGPEERKITEIDMRQAARELRKTIPEPFETRRREQVYGAGTLSKEENDLFSTSEVREKHETYAQTNHPQTNTSQILTSFKNAESSENNANSSRTITTYPKEIREVSEKSNTGIIKTDKETGQKDSAYEKAQSSAIFNQKTVAADAVQNAANEIEKTAVNNEFAEKTEEKQLELFEEKLLDPKSRSRHQLIGQLFDTYWLVQFENNFYIIDQHAAHEKVNYERFVKEYEEHVMESQYVSPPIILTLNLKEEALLEANRKYFEETGFEIEHFGGHEYSISAVPATLYGLTEKELFIEMLDQLSENNDKNAFQIFASRIATMACKAAVKGNNKMSAAEADRLIEELLNLENPYHCPHGRPTIISMSKREIEKKFKRIL
ncbi:MAG: DNA mismatch repair endonuclease MutL [Eubacteriales bacterium]|nr:DNA mismatch repair endonuclease MutL [Eubacteriales bacterium]